MSTLPTPILDTVLLVLVPFFLSVTGGDIGIARRAATDVLGEYNPATQEELRLAGEIVTYSLNALQALAESAGPDIPASRIIRLRGNAVSLRRVAGQAQRKLDQLQRARRAATPTAEATPTADPPTAEAATIAAGPDPAEPARTLAEPAEAQAETPAPTPIGRAATQPEPARNIFNPFQARHWSQAARKRAMAQQMAETSRRKKAEYEQQQAAAQKSEPLAPQQSGRDAAPQPEARSPQHPGRETAQHPGYAAAAAAAAAAASPAIQTEL